MSVALSLSQEFLRLNEREMVKRLNNYLDKSKPRDRIVVIDRCAHATKHFGMMVTASSWYNFMALGIPIKDPAFIDRVTYHTERCALKALQKAVDSKNGFDWFRELWASEWTCIGHVDKTGNSIAPVHKFDLVMSKDNYDFFAHPDELDGRKARYFYEKERKLDAEPQNVNKWDVDPQAHGYVSPETHVF